jgi:hypothetical protein
MAVSPAATSDDGDIGTRKYFSALPAPVFHECVPRLPLFYTDLGFKVFQIDYQTRKSLF